MTQQKTPAPVFLVSEDLRHQVRYWKDRRNDCAHFKANEIDHSHVESFWNFIFSNMGKFVPNGSAASLLNEIALHFDQDVTPPNTPLDPIIERIPHCVERDELTKFFEDLVEKISSSSDTARVFDAVIRITNNYTVNTLRNFLVSHKHFLRLLRNFPQHVILLDQNPELVRCLWRKHLFSSYHNDLEVFAALLRANMIPQEEIAEANDKAVTELKGNIPSPADKQTLDQYGFFAVFSERAFTDGLLDDFGWGNRNAKLVCWYLESYQIPVGAVRSICSIFNQSNCPWKARNRLTEMFKDNTNKRQEFEEIAQHEQLTLPEAIFGE